MEIEIIVKIDGKEVSNTKKMIGTDGNQQSTQYSEYARFFDEASPNWTDNAEYNLMFLSQKQQYLNDLLKSRGHVFLNDVYDELGIPRTKAGAVLGWVYDEKNPNGDNFIDFGIFNINNERCRNFVNGYEKTILLDFNVDGNIFDRLED